MLVTRFDRAPLARAVRTDEGFLVAPANLTRTGVFEYPNHDGTIRRELRLDADVFATSSLATYLDLAATIAVQTVEALTHGAVLFRPELLVGDAFARELTDLLVRYLVRDEDRRAG